MVEEMEYDVCWWLRGWIVLVEWQNEWFPSALLGQGGSIANYLGNSLVCISSFDICR